MSKTAHYNQTTRMNPHIYINEWADGQLIYRSKNRWMDR